MQPQSELSVASVHKALVEDPRQAFVQTQDGKLHTLNDAMKLMRPMWQVHIYPGSFNPLHDGHKAIYEAMPKAETGRFFELSINRFDKPPVSETELSERLRQFRGYAPVLVTNVAKFVEKAGLMRLYPLTFYHMGADTLARVLKHHSPLEVEGMNCQFVVYDRIVEGDKAMDLPAVLPGNVKKGKPLSDALMKLSSTAIRNARALTTSA